MSTIGRAEEQQNLSVSCAFEYEQMIEELFSGFHQGQRPAMPRKQAGHMTAPASTVHSVNLLLQTGGRPHMDADRAEMRRRHTSKTSTPRNAGIIACGSRTSICVHLRKAKGESEKRRCRASA